jgi:tetratricopeptide (TPR) repeat protein
MTSRSGWAIFALLLSGTAHAVVIEPRPPEARQPGAPHPEAARLELLAYETFEQLRPLFRTNGPPPELVVADTDRVDAKADDRATITITRGLLRLCVPRRPAPGTRVEEVTRTRIAFVLSHELAHVAHRHPGLFGAGIAEAVEKRADADAVGALFVAGFDTRQLRLGAFLQEIARRKKVTARGVRTRVTEVEKAVVDAQRHAGEWRLGWLLTVAGRYAEAREFYRAFGTRYPLPAALTALAHTRILAAWRIHPCNDRTVLEWFVPLRFDPRAQKAPFDVRSLDDSCRPFAREVRDVLAELSGDELDAYPPAQVAAAALWLLLGEPKTDAIADLGGVPPRATACPDPPAGDDGEARLRADACQISLLSRYENSARDVKARQAAIEGLRRLRDRWPDEPSLQFNLARLLTHAGAPAEAAPLWAQFLHEASEGPYRDEAQQQLARVAPPAAPSPAPPPLAAALLPKPAEIGTPTRSPLDARAPKCSEAASRGRLTISPERYLFPCGDWAGELVVRDTRGVFIRSVSASSPFWPDTSPPPAVPLFSSNGPTGEVLKVWQDEAWVFRDGAPERVVYFKRPQQ